jgi:hypothetical protein
MELKLVYKFLLIWDAQINTCLSIYEPVFTFQAPSSCKPIIVPSASREVMGN